jgi:hypothetical protein
MKKVVLFSTMLLAFFLTSCNKDITVEQENTQAEVKHQSFPHKYKIDGKEVSREEFFSTLLGNHLSLRDLTSNMSAVASNYRVVEELARPEPTGTFNVTNAFTATQPYIDYAVSSGYTNVQTVETAYSDLAAYAESSGAIAEFEQTGVVPASYMQYMKSYFQQKSLPYDDGTGLQTRGLTNFVNKECDNSGSGWAIRTNPWLGMFGYNNNISRYLIFGIGGHSDIFDNSFFRSRLVGIWNWGLTSIIFCNEFQWVNDKATSWGSF